MIAPITGTRHSSTELKFSRLLREPEIVRNRAKVVSTIGNARAVLAVQRELGSFSELLWSFVPEGRPIVSRPAALGEYPAQTAESRAMSKALKKRGFSFVGPTICYALMQSCGLVDDHMAGCSAGARLAALRATTGPAPRQ